MIPGNVKGFPRELSILIPQFANIELICGECRARLAYTYVQPDLAVHTSLFYHLILSTKLHQMPFNPLTNDKISDWSKSKAFADEKINVTKKLKLVLGRVENIEGKGENAGSQHFLLFPQCFQKASYIGSLKVGIVW